MTLLTNVFLPLLLLGTVQVAQPEPVPEPELAPVAVSTPAPVPTPDPDPEPPFVPSLPTGCTDQPPLALVWSDENEDDYEICQPEELVGLTAWYMGDYVDHTITTVWEDGSVQADVHVSIAQVDMGQPQLFTISWCAAPTMGCTP